MSGMDFLLGLCLLQLTRTAESTAPAYLEVFLRKLYWEVLKLKI